MLPHGPTIVGLKRKFQSPPSFTFAIIAVIFLSQLAIISASPYVSSEDLPKPEAWRSSEEVDDDDGDYLAFMQKLIAGIVTFVIVVVVVCLVLCFCCPICIIAKMRQRRGVVIRTPAGTTTTQNGNSVTVTVNRSAPPPQPVANATSPQVVAISNNLNSRNKPYPVQESVTVVPLLQPQMSAQYPSHPQPMNIGYPPGPQYPQNFELPPPYPGLPRDPDTSNLPYNPYFTGDDSSPSAPPPK